MRRILLSIGGVVQVLLAGLHVFMFFGMERAKGIPSGLKPLLHIFNAAVLTVVLFFAYVSFFQRRALAETPLGRAVCWFIALFYLQRGLTELVVSGLNPIMLGAMLAIAALYAWAAVPSRAPLSTASVGQAA